MVTIFQEKEGGKNWHQKNLTKRKKHFNAKNYNLLILNSAEDTLFLVKFCRFLKVSNKFEFLNQMLTRYERSSKFQNCSESKLDLVRLLFLSIFL
jgi:hypothetical protein